jgi:hypothetical protein
VGLATTSASPWCYDSLGPTHGDGEAVRWAGNGGLVKIGETAAALIKGWELDWSAWRASPGSWAALGPVENKGARDRSELSPTVTKGEKQRRAVVTYQFQNR